MVSSGKVSGVRGRKVRRCEGGPDGVRLHGARKVGRCEGGPNGLNGPNGQNGQNRLNGHDPDGEGEVDLIE